MAGILKKKAGFGLGTLLNKLRRYLYQNPGGCDPDEIDMIIITGDGVSVNNSYYNKEQIKEMVRETAQEKSMIRVEKEGAVSCRLPGIGKVIQRKDGCIEIGGIEIQKKSWLYHEIKKLFVK